jgi:ribonuclease VapC
VIIDTSALVAILRDEPDATQLIEAIRSMSRRRISAGTYVELGIVIDRPRSAVASKRMDDLLAQMAITIEPVTESQARIARDAYREYGKGSGHKAGLNYGDCFSYALARELGEPLLFKGDDFARTDIPFVGPRVERHRLSELIASYRAESA